MLAAPVAFVVTVTLPVWVPPAVSAPEGCVTEQVGGAAAVDMTVHARLTVPEAVLLTFSVCARTALAVAAGVGDCAKASGAIVAQSKPINVRFMPWFRLFSTLRTCLGSYCHALKNLACRSPAAGHAGSRQKGAAGLISQPCGPTYDRSLIIPPRQRAEQRADQLGRCNKPGPSGLLEAVRSLLYRLRPRCWPRC